MVVGLRRAVRLENKDYSDRLKGTYNIRKETVRGDLTEIFKIVSGREKVKMEDFFEHNQRNYNLRGLQFKRSRTYTRSNFFSQRHNVL